MTKKRSWGCGLVFTTALLTWSGCRGCQPASGPPLLVPQEGQLPKAPVASQTPGNPVAEAPPPGCVVILTPDVDRGQAPLEVRFTAEGLCSDAPGEFDWDFGDGSPPLIAMKPEQPPDKADYAFVRTQHVYTKPGEYIAKVTLRDPQNNVSDVDEYPITVESP